MQKIYLHFETKIICVINRIGHEGKNTISTSDRELIDRTYIVTPTTTAWPGNTKHRLMCNHFSPFLDSTTAFSALIFLIPSGLNNFKGSLLIWNRYNDRAVTDYVVLFVGCKLIFYWRIMHLLLIMAELRI